MLIKDIFKAITGAGKTVHKSVKSSLKFMDDVLEKEYIVNTIDDIKESTGDLVQKSGEIYERTKSSINEMKDDVKEAFEGENEIKENIKDAFEEE